MSMICDQPTLLKYILGFAVAGVMLLSGCATPSDEGYPSLPEDEFWSLEIRSIYDKNLRSDTGPHDEDTDLPDGHPAKFVEFTVRYRDPEDLPDDVWDFDDPCRITDHEHGSLDCSHLKDDSRSTYILPPPAEAIKNDGLPFVYLLDENGRIVVRFPSELETSIGFGGDYSAELMKDAPDASRCPNHPQVEGLGGPDGWNNVQGAITFVRHGEAVRISGDGSMEGPWYGRCPEYEEV